MRPVAVAIMAKWPRAGEVKTRLCPPLAPAEAAALYRCFLLDKIDQVRALRHALPVIAYTPDDAHGDFEALAPDFTLVAQTGADLGSLDLLFVSSAADAHRLVVGSFNVESGGADIQTVARHVNEQREVDTWGFSEVQNADAAEVLR